MFAVDVKVLDDHEWEAQRDAITQRFFGIDAADFIRRYTAGEYDDVEPNGLMLVLSYFPELD